MTAPRVTFGAVQADTDTPTVAVFLDGQQQPWTIRRDADVSPVNWYTSDGPAGDTDHGRLVDAKRAVTAAVAALSSPSGNCGHKRRGAHTERPAGTISQRAVTRGRRDAVLKLRLDEDLLRRVDALASMLDAEAGEYTRQHYLPKRRITRSAAVRSLLAAVLDQVENGRAAPVLLEAVQHALLRHD